VLGRYEACIEPRALADLADPDWVIESVDASDAFAALATLDRQRFARVYGGRRARRARRWTQTPDRSTSDTYISPYPDSTLTALEPGTLLVRWICEAADDPDRRACRP